MSEIQKVQKSTKKYLGLNTARKLVMTYMIQNDKISGGKND